MTDEAARQAPTPAEERDVSWGQVGRVAAPLRDQVLSAVRQAILDFELRPGERLIERELMERLQVSRTTVRDVLARLGTEGLVTHVPQRGAVVTVITREEAADIYEMRASLEPLAVRRFVERARPDEVAELREAASTLLEVASKVAAEPGAARPIDALRAKDSVYEVLMAGARSPRLTQVLSTLHGQVQFLRATSLSVDGRSLEAAQEIERIVQAIQVGDAPAAASACERHVRKAAEVGLAKLDGLVTATEGAATA